MVRASDRVVFMQDDIVEALILARVRHPCLLGTRLWQERGRYPREAGQCHPQVGLVLADAWLCVGIPAVLESTSVVPRDPPGVYVGVANPTTAGG